MTKEIREYYGIPQGLFADFLGIPRSQLSMAESGRRSISGEITLGILPFYLATLKTESKSKDEKLDEQLAIQKQHLNKLIDSRQKENKYRLLVLERSLFKMKEDQARCLKILNSLQVLKTEATTKEKDEGLIFIIEYNCRKLQNKTGEDSLFKIELQIQNLQAEMLYLENRKK